METLLLLVLLVLPFVAFVILARTRSRIEKLEGLAGTLNVMVERLARRLSDLEREVRILRELPPQAAVAREEAPIVVERAAPVPALLVDRAPAVEIPVPTPPAEPTPAVAGPLTMPGLPPSYIPQPLVPPTAEPAPAVPKGATPTEASPQAPSISRPSVAPVQKRGFDWEGLVGVKLFSWIAGIALALAGIFFLRYSIEAGWLQPPVRMAIGIIVGIGVLGLCELKVARKFAVTANALDASGIVILFSTFFASHSLWRLISVVPAFLFLFLVTVVAVLLSIRRESLFIALLGLIGGFSTPALLSTGEDHPIGLFGYLLLLNGGLAWVASRKRWPLLTTLSLVLTTIYQWSWVMKFLTAGKLPLATGIFLVFPILTFFAITLRREKTATSDWKSLFGQSGSLSAALPMVFALYLAAVPGYGAHYGILFGFLLCLDVGLFAVAAARGPEILHLAGGLSTIVVFATWFKVSYEAGSAWPGVLLFNALFVGFYLAAPLIARRFGRGFSGLGRRAVFAAPLLLFAIPVLAGLEPACAAPGLLFSALFLLLMANSSYAVTQGRGAVHFLAVFFALIAETVWTVKYLSADRLLQGLALYAVFGLYYLSVPVLARRFHKALRPESAGALLPLVSFGPFLGLAGHLFLFFVASQRSLAVPPWPLLVVLAVLDVAIGAAALYMRRGELSIAAVVASALILVIWEAVAAVSPWPVVAVLSSGVLVLFGLLWMYLARRTSIESVLFDGAGAVALLLAEIVTIVASAQAGSPALEFLIGAHLVFLAALLSLSWLRGWHFLALIGVAQTALAVYTWQELHRDALFWKSELLFAAAIYLAFLVYPLLLGRRVGRVREPYLAAVLASAAFFLFARHSLIAGGLAGIIGILPVTQAVLMGMLLLVLLRIEPPGDRSLGRLALVAGAALAFVTVAIPLQLEKEWITVGWALEGMALAWLFGKIPHRGLLLASSGLLATVFIRLALNPSVFVYHPRGSLRIWNWYLYTYLVCAAAHLLAGRLLAKTNDLLLQGVPRASRLLPAGGTILLFLLLNIEIADFYSSGPSLTFNFFSATLAQDLTYTLAWALFALGLLGIGIIIRDRPARIAALVLLIATILKCFLHDLRLLAGLFRVGSFVGLAICLALVAVLLQKFVLTKSKGAK